MPLQFFKPTKTNSGAASSWRFFSKDGSFLVQIIKQTGWNDEYKTGSFKDGEKMSIKLSLTEAGSIINSIRSKSEFSTVHKTKDRTLSLKFSPYIDKESKTYKGFGLSASAGENKYFRIGFTPADLCLLEQFIGFGMNHCFSAIYAEDKKYYLDMQKSGNSEQTRTPQKSKIKKEDALADSDNVESDSDSSGMSAEDF